MSCLTGCTLYAVKAQTSLAPLSWFHGSRITTAHAHQCCTFQSYAKTVPSRIKLTMKLTMREPASMTTDTWSRRVTSDFNSVLLKLYNTCYRPYALMSRLHNNDPMLGVKTCRAARTCCAVLGDGARDSASFDGDPQHAVAPFCDVICIRSIVLLLYWYSNALYHSLLEKFNKTTTKSGINSQIP